MASKIDLHMHSTASDGTDSPAELVRKVTAAGIRVFALTDHDTVAGIEETAALVPEGVEFIPGVEFSCRALAGKCHILGYGCDTSGGEFEGLLRRVSESRKNKLARRLTALREERGITFPEVEVERLSQIPSAGKPHIANLLVKYGYAENVGEAIGGILDKLHCGSGRLPADVVIKAILAAGGTPVWAHPLGGVGERELDETEFQALLGELMGHGLEGLECYYSKYPIERCRGLAETAREHGLYIYGGSDYHGRNKSIALGTLNAGDVEIPESELSYR